MTNPLRELQRLGQSVWLDYIRHDLLTSGELRRLSDEDGVAGVTSNPSIFEKAVASSGDYDALIAAHAGQSAGEIFDALAIEEVRLACDVLAPVFERTGGADGFVSLEVPASVAYDTAQTMRAVRQYWQAVDKPNVMIKIPATRAGLSAIEDALAEGININITLIFAVERYQAVVEAHLRALERRAAQGQPINALSSVASFFVSRVDTLVDRLLQEKATGAPPDIQRRVAGLLGKIAIANSCVAYRHFQKVMAGERFKRLAALGARPQRVLWASTSTKNPKYPDTYYVNELIGPHTVNTMPPETLALFREHGQVRPSLEENSAEAETLLDRLGALGISLPAVTQQLEEEGVRLFDDAYNKLLKAIEQKARKVQ